MGSRKLAKVTEHKDKKVTSFSVPSRRNFIAEVPEPSDRMGTLILGSSGLFFAKWYWLELT